MMKEKTAKDTMKNFYSVGYQTLLENRDIQGIFISDCGILFSGYENMQNKQQQLPSILKVVKDINIKMLNYDVMLTTSIVYGEFSIKKNLEAEGIVKTPVYGDAYISAYLDNDDLVVPQTFFAADLTAGFILFDFLDISYTLRTNFISMNHKASLGFVYRFK